MGSLLVTVREVGPEPDQREFYVLAAEVDLPSTVDIDALASQLNDVATGVGVEATLRSAETDVL